METISQAIGIVRRAENDIRQLILRYVDEGDYENVRILANWAQQLRQMSQNNVSSSPSTENSQSLPAVPSGPRKSRRKLAKVNATKNEYPKFFRDSDELVKIGWSKKQKSEYRHKAPRDVILMVAKTLQQKGASVERFTFEELLPLHDPKTQAELPSYQGYLALAWLRKEKLIVQHARQGYSLLPDTNLTDAVEERWKLLPKL